MNKYLIKKLRCLNCVKKKKYSSLLKKKNILICKKCGEVYPIFQNFPVILSSKNDFNHLRNALLPSKFRINYKWK
jgi:uncharacterized protein YbaR (Trm112 family)